LRLYNSIFVTIIEPEESPKPAPGTGPDRLYCSAEPDDVLLVDATGEGGAQALCARGRRAGVWALEARCRRILTMKANNPLQEDNSPEQPMNLGDRVVCLFEQVDRSLILLEGMTVVGLDGTQVLLRDVEAEVIRVDRDNVFRSLAHAQERLGWTDSVFLRDGPVQTRRVLRTTRHSSRLHLRPGGAAGEGEA
jgi:hypothetical protein